MIALSVLRAHLKEPPAAENGLIRRYEQAAVAHVERETGRYFGAPAERTEYLTGDGQRELWLSEVPTGPVTVTADGAAVAASAFTVRERRLRHTSVWGSPDYPADLVVTYTAGYMASGTGDEVDIAAPADIREAVLELTALYYEERLPVAAGTVVATMPHRVTALIASHRRLAL